VVGALSFASEGKAGELGGPVCQTVFGTRKKMTSRSTAASTTASTTASTATSGSQKLQYLSKGSYCRVYVDPADSTKVWRAFRDGLALLREIEALAWVHGSLDRLGVPMDERCIAAIPEPPLTATETKASEPRSTSTSSSSSSSSAWTTPQLPGMWVCRQPRYQKDLLLWIQSEYDPRNKADQADLEWIFYQVAIGTCLSALTGVFWMDVKHSNILLSWPDKDKQTPTAHSSRPRVQVALNDWNLLWRVQERKADNSYMPLHTKMTWWYRAPELFHQPRRTQIMAVPPFASLVWAVGVLIALSLYWDDLYPVVSNISNDDNEVDGDDKAMMWVQYLCSGKNGAWKCPQPVSTTDAFPLLYEDLLSQCLRIQPAERCTLPQVCAHPVFQRLVPLAERGKWWNALNACSLSSSLAFTAASTARAPVSMEKTLEWMSSIAPRVFDSMPVPTQETWRQRACEYASNGFWHASNRRGWIQYQQALEALRQDRLVSRRHEAPSASSGLTSASSGSTSASSGLTSASSGSTLSFKYSRSLVLTAPPSKKETLESSKQRLARYKANRAWAFVMTCMQYDDVWYDSHDLMTHDAQTEMARTILGSMTTGEASAQWFRLVGYLHNDVHETSDTIHTWLTHPQFLKAEEYLLHRDWPMNRHAWTATSISARTPVGPLTAPLPAAPVPIPSAVFYATEQTLCDIRASPYTMDDVVMLHRRLVKWKYPTPGNRSTTTTTTTATTQSNVSRSSATDDDQAEWRSYVAALVSCVLSHTDWAFSMDHDASARFLARFRTVVWKRFLRRPSEVDAARRWYDSSCNHLGVMRPKALSLPWLFHHVSRRDCMPYKAQAQIEQCWMRVRHDVYEAIDTYHLLDTDKPYVLARSFFQALRHTGLIRCPPPTTSLPATSETSTSTSTSSNLFQHVSGSGDDTVMTNGCYAMTQLGTSDPVDEKWTNAFASVVRTTCSDLLLPQAASVASWSSCSPLSPSSALDMFSSASSMSATPMSSPVLK
jgi:serine/threonine protein kinase